MGVYGILYMYGGKTHEGFYNKKVPPSYVKNACKYKVLWEFENSRIWFLKIADVVKEKIFLAKIS